MQENTSTESGKATLCPYLSQLKLYSSQETSLLQYLVEHYALMAMNKATKVGKTQGQISPKFSKISRGIRVFAKSKGLNNEMPIVPSTD